MMKNIRIKMIEDEYELDRALEAMNEGGFEPNIPFIDANGNSNLAMGQAPSGDDWQVGFVIQEPDSGTLAHCCVCADHNPTDECDIVWDWTPTYPLMAFIYEGES